ncbi:hypothetical protein ABFS82_06G189800 [Erythranthe guttata]|uniref:auxin response factor 18-like n=1 Tax=Erythranthe guttata TaxID=4155 RepID=UPI00064DB251|nr:PREDICTED: auxin response factor 18-like [Erythranthe guttata]|eukprot:XP_012834747.1 PREDICTED: auxin response factor 18-like [Erythranthe guttata]
MINVMHSANKPMNQVEKILDPQLWQACAGGMAQIPPPNSKVYYFPQGHSEHANRHVDFNGFSRIPPIIPCRVSAIKYLADSDSDEVYAKIRLVPLSMSDYDANDDNNDDNENGFLGFDKCDEKEKTTNSFAKTLTQSDANNGGGFSVPRYCAETIFPRLDYSAEPPVQTILVKDVHGEVWKFRHIYRGTPRRHLLTTGWSNFVNRKKVVAGDSIVFLRAENGDLCVGIRRAKRGVNGGQEVVCGWSSSNGASASSLYRGFSDFLSGNRNNVMCDNSKGIGNCELPGVKERGNVSGESVLEAVNLAVNGRPFEVVYYPLASTPEFVVRVRAVRAAMRVRWCSGMRFKMAFETEDSSRISWFMGTISSVQVDDPIRWPNSPWRLLQVAWDEPDLLQNVKRVSPWLVELVSNMPPGGNLPPFSPPRKRPRFPLPSDFLLPTFFNNPLSPISPLCFLPENIPTGVQGARHARFESQPSDLVHFKKQIQPFDFKLLDDDDDALSRTKPMFRLFGQPILSAEQISRSYSVDNNTEGYSLSDGNQENTGNVSNGSGSGVVQNFPPEASEDECKKLDLGLET